MAAVVSKAKGTGALPNDALLHALTFLEPVQVARVESVCRQWKEVIGSADQHIWKDFCLMQQIPVVSADLIKKEIEDSELGLHTSQCGKFTSQILENIIGYVALHETTTSAAINYKNTACVVHANIKLDWATCHIYIWPKNSWLIDHDWGDDESEPFVGIRVGYGKFSNKLTREEMEENWGPEKTKVVLNSTPVCVQSFPRSVPLRFFMKPDGTLKDGGDTIQFVFCDRMLRLTCQNEVEYRNGRLFSSTFKQGLEKRLDICRNVPGSIFVKDDGVAFSKTLAKAAGEWFHLKMRPKQAGSDDQKKDA